MKSQQKTSSPIPQLNWTYVFPEKVCPAMAFPQLSQDVCHFKSTNSVFCYSIVPRWVHHLQAMLTVTNCRKLVCHKILLLRVFLLQECNLQGKRGRRRATSEIILDGLNLHDISKKITPKHHNPPQAEKKNLNFQAIKTWEEILLSVSWPMVSFTLLLHIVIQIFEFIWIFR